MGHRTSPRQARGWCAFATNVDCLYSRENILRYIESTASAGNGRGVGRAPCSVDVAKRCRGWRHACGRARGDGGAGWGAVGGLGDGRGIGGRARVVEGRGRRGATKGRVVVVVGVWSGERRGHCGGRSGREWAACGMAGSSCTPPGRGWGSDEEATVFG